jgi:hypothetical protein
VTRRNLRTFLAVFLTVLCAGFGVSGAAAVWSQNATLTTTVATGTWVDYTRPGWSVSLTTSAALTDYNGTGRYTFRFSWAPVDAPDTSSPVEYRVNLEAVDNGRVLSTTPVTVPDRTRSVSLSVLRPVFRDADFRLTITPVINGVAGQPTVKTLRTSTWGGYDFD